MQSNNVKSVGVHSQLSHNQLLMDGVLVTAFVHSGQNPKPLATPEKVICTIFFFSSMIITIIFTTSTTVSSSSLLPPPASSSSTPPLPASSWKTLNQQWVLTGGNKKVLLASSFSMTAHLPVQDVFGGAQTHFGGAHRPWPCRHILVSITRPRCVQ